MDASQKENKELLDFTSFIKNYFPTYQIDGNNSKLITQIGLWAIRFEEFNKMEDGWHIDRGLLISGPVGAGKDELFRLLRKYISYLGSPYGYGSKVVWEFAKPFMKDGYDCFNEQTGNIYYEELALTDEATGQPTREFVNHFGTKILIGSEIINVRYNVFKNYGYQTHFSTNLNEDELEKVYGKRCMSRLYEMCNFMVLSGKDRRGRVDPEFKSNKNKPVTPNSRETTIEEHFENKQMLEREYKQYCETGSVSELVSLNYDLLLTYGCKLEIQKDVERSTKFLLLQREYTPAIGAKLTNSEREREQNYYAWGQLKKISVISFYSQLKQSGAKSIFNDVEVNLKLPDEKDRAGGKSISEIINKNQ